MATAVIVTLTLIIFGAGEAKNCEIKVLTVLLSCGNESFRVCNSSGVWDSFDNFVESSSPVRQDKLTKNIHESMMGRELELVSYLHHSDPLYLQLLHH